MNSSPRIVSLLSSATEMLYLLGLGEQVVGVSHECDFPADATTKPRVTRSIIDSAATSGVIDDQVKSLLAAGLPLYEIDIPALIDLAPDLIVTQAQCDVCAVRYDDVLAAVANQPQLAGTRVVALNPNSLDDVLADIGRIAIEAGVEDAGQHVVTELRQRVLAVQTKTATLRPDSVPRVACIEWIEPLMLAGNWMPELVAMAGGEHRLSRAGVHSQYSLWESLVDYNPQVIAIMPCGFDLERSIVEAQPLVDRPGWLQIDAVRQGRVYAVDANSYFNRSGPRLVESLELLAHLIHPELFAAPVSLNPARDWHNLTYPQAETCHVL